MLLKAGDCLVHSVYTVQQCLLYCQVVSELHIEDAFAGGQADSGLRPKQENKTYFSIKTGTFIVGKEYV
jgi:hypothetical protein